jgi:hypothetical protein
MSVAPSCVATRSANLVRKQSAEHPITAIVDNGLSTPRSVLLDSITLLSVSSITAANHKSPGRADLITNPFGRAFEPRPPDSLCMTSADA